jgi:GNAT acetyltransferase-like protein
MNVLSSEVRLNFRLACRADDEAILRLLRICYPHLSFSPAWWNWFSRERTDAQNQTYLAEDDEGIIGCLSFMPITVCVGPYRGPASVCANIAVHPGFRRSAGNRTPAVFARLLEYALQDRRHKMEGLQFSVPNNNSRSTFLRSGWRVVSPLQTFEKRRCSGKSPDWEEVRDFNKNYDLLNTKVTQSLDFCVYKTSEYLRWRLLSRPDSSYRIFVIKRGSEWLACTVLKPFVDRVKNETKLHVMHMLALDDNIAAQLLQAIEAFSTNYDIVNIWVADGDIHEPLLRRRKFREQGSRDLVGIADKPERWRAAEGRSNFSFSDIDVY